jgi:hypothetical protein
MALAIVFSTPFSLLRGQILDPLLAVPFVIRFTYIWVLVWHTPPTYQYTTNFEEYQII